MNEIYRRGVTGALALLLDMAIERASARWSPTAGSILGLVLARVPRRMPGSVGLWAEAGLLSTTLGLHRLAESGEPDEAAPEPAQSLATLADTASEEVVAPLCYYLVGGLPGAMLYRLAISMQEQLGPRGAEIVRLLRAVPARLTGALFVAAAHLRRENGARALRIWRRDGWHAPNAERLGPRSALAGALGVEVAGEGQDAVGAGERPATADDVERAGRLLRTSVALGAGLMLGVPLLARLRK